MEQLDDKPIRRNTRTHKHTYTYTHTHSLISKMWNQTSNPEALINKTAINPQIQGDVNNSLRSGKVQSSFKASPPTWTIWRIKGTKHTDITYQQALITADVTVRESGHFYSQGTFVCCNLLNRHWGLLFPKLNIQHWFYIFHKAGRLVIHHRSYTTHFIHLMS